MTILSDKLIRDSGILEPCLEFTNKSDLPWDDVGTKIISKGLSSYGYDLTCSNEFKIFKNNNTELLVDPKNFNENNYDHIEDEYCIIPANSFVLTRSIERFRIPRDVIGICMGKSTYARCGIVANITLLEPEWEGELVIELSNTSPLPVKIYANEGIAQVVFFKTGNICEVSYADRKGKYQNQSGIQTAKV